MQKQKVLVGMVLILGVMGLTMYVESRMLPPQEEKADYYQQAEQLLNTEQGSREEALALNTKALDLEPENTLALYQKVRLGLTLPKPEVALAGAQALVDMQSDNYSYRSLQCLTQEYVAQQADSALYAACYDAAAAVCLGAEPNPLKEFDCTLLLHLAGAPDAPQAQEAYLSSASVIDAEFMEMLLDMPREGLVRHLLGPLLR